MEGIFLSIQKPLRNSNQNRNKSQPNIEKPKERKSEKFTHFEKVSKKLSKNAFFVGYPLRGLFFGRIHRPRNNLLVKTEKKAKKRKNFSKKVFFCPLSVRTCGRVFFLSTQNPLRIPLKLGTNYNRISKNQKRKW